MDKALGAVLLLLLSGLWAGARGEGVNLGPIELAPIPCNDKAVEKLSRLAITYLNEDRNEGYKFALNRIANVYLHAQGPAGNVYYLDLDVLETKCHVGSPKPWKRCDVRPFMETQISGNCNTTLLHTPEGYTYLYSYDCYLVPDPPEKLQQTCPTCPLMVPVDSPQAEDAAALTLAHFQRQSTLATRLGVKKITRAATQTRPVKARFVEYTVQDCPEGLTDRGTCQRLTVDSDTETAGFCAGSVHGDIDQHPEVQVSCEMYKTQNVDIFRPVAPQVHDLPAPPPPPTFPAIFVDPGLDPLPDPTLPPAVDPAPFQPTPAPPPPYDPPAPPPPAPFDPPAPPAPVPGPFASSSSESEERFRGGQQPHAAPAGAAPFDSSSEEVLGLVALRPPLSFRYQRRDRKRRQALMEPPPSHNPLFLTDFPSGPSPFRSCPGPSRYTTV